MSTEKLIEFFYLKIILIPHKKWSNFNDLNPVLDEIKKTTHTTEIEHVNEKKTKCLPLERRQSWKSEQALP